MFGYFAISCTLSCCIRVRKNAGCKISKTQLCFRNNVFNFLPTWFSSFFRFEFERNCNTQNVTADCFDRLFFCFNVCKVMYCYHKTKKMFVNGVLLTYLPFQSFIYILCIKISWKYMSSSKFCKVNWCKTNISDFSNSLVLFTISIL